MQLHTLKRNTQRKTKQQIGRGAKRGKTSGRGQKGQASRAGRKMRPEIREVIKKIPKLRGRGKNMNKSFEIKPVVLNLRDLANIEANTVLTPKKFVDLKLVELLKGKVPSIKILGTGEISQALTFKKVAVSASAIEKIEKAGGKVYVK
ncbi:MAG: uL15m family ribosomal protein [Patescibacteria group bacterium]